MRESYQSFTPPAGIPIDEVVKYIYIIYTHIYIYIYIYNFVYVLFKYSGKCIYIYIYIYICVCLFCCVCIQYIYRDIFICPYNSSNTCLTGHTNVLKHTWQVGSQTFQSPQTTIIPTLYKYVLQGVRPRIEPSVAPEGSVGAEWYFTFFMFSYSSHIVGHTA